MVRRIFAALALACALAASACVPKDGTGTSTTGWQQIAAGVGQVIGKTKVDDQVAKASAKLDQSCAALRAVALGTTMFSPERYRLAAQQASAVVNTVCDHPPEDVASALKLVADAYAAAVAAADGA
jgi:hypothetical protein